MQWEREEWIKKLFKIPCTVIVLDLNPSSSREESVPDLCVVYSVCGRGRTQRPARAVMPHHGGRGGARQRGRAGRAGERPGSGTKTSSGLDLLELSSSSNKSIQTYTSD